MMRVSSVEYYELIYLSSIANLTGSCVLLDLVGVKYILSGPYGFHYGCDFRFMLDCSPVFMPYYGLFSMRSPYLDLRWRSRSTGTLSELLITSIARHKNKNMWVGDPMWRSCSLFSVVISLHKTIHMISTGDPPFTCSCYMIIVSMFNRWTLHTLTHIVFYFLLKWLVWKGSTTQGSMLISSGLISFMWLANQKRCLTYLPLLLYIYTD